MIQSKKDLNNYLEEDRVVNAPSSFKKPKFVGMDTWKFLIALRKLEYYKNTRSNPLFAIFHKCCRAYYQYKHYSLGMKLGFSIPVNTVGPGFSLHHKGTVVIHTKAKIGKNCCMHVCINIGASGGSKKAPQIGNNVYIAPGVKIFGDITIADNVWIGANAVVNKSITEEYSVVAGVPAKIIKKLKPEEVFSYR